MQMLIGAMEVPLVVQLVVAIGVPLVFSLVVSQVAEAIEAPLVVQLVSAKDAQVLVVEMLTMEDALLEELVVFCFLSHTGIHFRLVHRMA